MLPSIIGWLFVVVSLATGGMAILHHVRELRPRHWPSTEGEVVESVLVHDGYHADGVARVRYRYSVDHLSYVGERLSMSMTPREGRSSRRILRMHPVGQAVKVFYDPDDPETAVIERPLTPEWMVLVALAVLFLLMGLMLAFDLTRTADRVWP